MRRLPSLVLVVLLATWSTLGLVAPATAAPPTTADAPTSSVAHPFVNQAFVLSGKIGTSGARPVTLQHKSSTWKDDQTVSTKSDGSYSFTAKTSKSERDFRVVAAATSSLPAVTSDAITIETLTDSVRLVLSRNRSTGLAVGTSEVPISGRQWSLQVDDGGWTQIGAKHNEGSDGSIRASFPLKSGSYRLVGDPVAKGVDGQNLDGATSDERSFKKGPSSLGKNVMFIATDSGKTPKKKGKDYAATVGLNDADPLPLETVAVRGNTSSAWDKKPYKIKFVDSQSPFGLPKGKTFILLANFIDHSLVRNSVAMDEAQQLGGLRWTPHSVFTEVFMNGTYRGSYELIESIKIQQKSKKNDARVDIDAEKGVIIEINPVPHSDAVGLFKGGHGMYYGFKDPDEEDEDDPEAANDAKEKAMKTKIKNFESVLYGKNYKDPVKGWRKYLDEDSAVDFYLENEFIKNWDGDFFLSTFFYTADYSDPNAKLFMGPIWDEDRTAGCRTSGTSSVTSTKGWWLDGSGVGHANQANEAGDVHKKQWFARITNDKAFQKALKARWAEKKSTFKAIGNSGVDAAASELGKNVAANDRDLWQGKQPIGRYLPRAKSYAGEIRYLKNWYQDRYKWMNGKLD